MIFFQNIYMLIINPNLRLEYKEIDEDNYEKINEVM
jgi:hypothetical protein